MRDAPLMFCPGCQHGTVLRLVASVLEELEIAGRSICVTGVGCNYVSHMYLGIDGMDALHGRAPNIATGIKLAHYNEKIVFTMQGDGDCAAIGMGDLINAVHRGVKLTTIMVNNANYGTTGGQMAPTTILGQKTSTTPEGRQAEEQGFPAHMAELMASLRGVSYSARVALNTVANYNRARRALRTAFQKQIDGIGYSFVEILSACPPNWKMTPLEALEWIGREMIEEFPLGEFKNVKDPRE